MKKLILCVLSVLLFGPALRAESTGEILTFPANPEKGFHWGYALYLPKTMDTSKKLPILFEMNNVGITSTEKEAEERTLHELRNNSFVYQIPDGLGLPMLMPLVQRENRGDPELYTHDLNRAVFVSQEEKLKRLDVQVLNMIKDAREQLKKRGIRTTKKVLVAGYSASGDFCWRWTMLHPEQVLAAACGGQHYPMLPLETIGDINLIYPVGVGDLKELTGKKFNKRAWLKVPVFSYEGEKDINDPLPYDDCYSSKIEKPILQQVLPEYTVLARVQHAYRVINEKAPNVQTHIYPNMEHTAMTADMVTFLRQHINGGALKPIKVTDTSNDPSDIPVKVSKLFWGYEAPAACERDHLSATDLIMQSTYVPRGVSCALDILHNGQVILTKPQNYCRGWLKNRKGDNYIQIHFSDEELAKLRSYKDRTFSVRSHHPEILEIPENLTFTIK
ncbi:MAG: hypothetical protein J6V32_06135 [Elusimicrobiaceae bacterium]|nr:hypothetical protein [Elusimicrobiaceae bacterium]